MLFPYKENPVAEPYSVTETADVVSYVGQSWRLDFGVDRYRWGDAGGRLDADTRRLGQVCTFWVPSSRGTTTRRCCARTSGMAKGRSTAIRSDGLFMLDYIYSFPGAMWTEMGMLTKLHNVWLNWLVEYEDGGYEGGYAWRGPPRYRFRRRPSLCRRGQHGAQRRADRDPPH